MKKNILILNLLCCLFSISGMAQTMVSGTVTDDSGTAVIGAAVVLEGTSKGTSTDINGMFSIEVPKFPAKILVSFLGYELYSTTCERTQTNLKIVLKSDTRSIENVVVIGYGQQKKASVVGAISTATAKDLVKAPVGSVGTALVGRLTGLTTMQTSGQPGGESPTLRIRGVSTLNDASPLVIVDGIERSSGQVLDFANAGTSGSISGWESVNPNDIESVSILKDASATAVYGVKGANGVIIITTKKGLTGKPVVDYSGSFGLSTPIRLRQNIGSYEYGLFANEGQSNDGMMPFMSFEDLNKYRYNYNSILYPSMDYSDYILKKFSPKQTHNVSVRGGTDNVRYFASVGYYDEDGMIKNHQGYGFDPNQHYNRINLRTNLDFKFNKRFSASLNIDGRFEQRQGANAPSDSHFFWKLHQAHPWVSPGFDEQNRFILTQDEKEGPIMKWILGGGSYNHDQVTANTVFSLKHELDFITEGLSAQVKYSYDSFVDNWYTRNKGYATYKPIEVDNSIYYKKDGEDGWLGFTREAANKSKKQYFEASFNYARTFGLDHNVNALILYNQEKSFYRQPAFADVPRAYLGFVGRATYSFKNRYFGEFNIGINGSENFPKGQRFGIFPAYSLGWMLTEEKFMQNVKFISSLKIRGSYGTVGSDRVGNSRFLYIAGDYKNYPGSYNGIFGEPTTTTTKIPGIQEGTSANNNVTWETAKKTNIGIDARFFDDRLSFTIDIFKENRVDILTSMQTLPGFLYPAGLNSFPTGDYTTRVNYAKVDNKGLEVELGYDGKIGNDFTYNVKGSYAYNKNKALRLSEVDQPYPWLYSQGLSLNQVRGLVAEGYWDSYEDINNPNNPYNTFQPEAIPGDIKYKDINGDMKIDNYDYVPLGKNNMPCSTFSASLGFTYKNFEVSALFQGASDFYYMPNEESKIQMNGGWGSYTWIRERWTPQTRSGSYPVLHNLGTNNESGTNFRGSTFWAYDATYVRLKNLEVSYNLPIKLLQRIKIENIRIFLTAQNLFTWTPTPEMKRYDPEMVQGRLIYYPIMQIYNLGLAITF